MRFHGFLICDRIKMAVGEYADGYGFPLPNPVFIRREYLRLRLKIERCIKCFKNKDTWYGMLRYFRYRIRYDPEIVFLASKGGGIDGILYISSEPEWQPLCSLSVLER